AARCEPNAPHLAAIADQAARALDLVKLEKARALLARGPAAVLCDPDPVLEADLLRYLLLSGVLQVYLGTEDPAVFDDVLTVAPDMLDPSDYFKQAVKTFQEARLKLRNRSRVPIRIVPDPS